MDSRLIEAMRTRRVILFVGAGVSQNLNLPSFDELAGHIAEQLQFDDKIFKSHGDNRELFEYYYLEKGALGPLRSWMDTKWHTGIDIGTSEIHELIVKLDFPKIYTTNFDSWIERAHAHYGKGYQKISNAKDIVSSAPNITQIIKFHGDFDDDDSLVLTESNYFDRLDFESPLDVLLRADMLGNSILYVGYSLRDINLRYLLYKLQKQAVKVHLSKARPTSFVLLSRPNVVQEKILLERNVIPLVSEADHPGDGLCAFLKELYEEAVDG